MEIVIRVILVAVISFFTAVFFWMGCFEDCKTKNDKSCSKADMIVIWVLWFFSVLFMSYY